MEAMQLVLNSCSVVQKMGHSHCHLQHRALRPLFGFGSGPQKKRNLQCFPVTPSCGARSGKLKDCGPLPIGHAEWRRSSILCRPPRAGQDATFPLDNSAEKISGDEIVEGKELHFFQALVQFVDSNFLPIVLLSSMLFGLTWPAPGQALQRLGISKWVTTTFFLIFGLTSGNKDIEKATSAWPAGIFGMISILLLTPLAAIPILCLPIAPRELAAGLAIFACVPTTLSSGVALTQIAGANTGLALGLTVFSNLLSVVTMPFFLTGLVGQGIGVSMPPGPLVKSLILTLLLPLILGKILREVFSDFGKYVDKRRKQISKVTTLLMSLVPWMQMSTSRCMLLQVGALDLFISCASGAVLHAVYLIVNSTLMKIWPRPSNNKDVFENFNSRAVLIVSSEKSIIVAVAVIDRLGGVFGNAGLLLLPCIAAQLIQVTMDSMLVSSWLQKDSKKKPGTYGIK